MPEKASKNQQEQAAKDLKRRIEKLLKKGHDRVIIGTSSARKIQGMSEPYSDNGQSLMVVPLEKHGYEEPPDYDAIRTVESKALAALIIFGFAECEEFRDPSLQFDVEGELEYDPVAEKKDILVDVQDSTTRVYPLDENGNRGEPINFLKKSRDFRNYLVLSLHEKRQLLDDDKQQYKEEVYSGFFETEFEGARGVLSTGEGRIANSIALKFIVVFKPLPDDVVDKAYENPNVWNVGPRVDLATLVSVRPDLVEKVEVIDLHKNKKKRMVLEQSKYSMVTDLIVFGRVNEETMLKLLKKEKKLPKKERQKYKAWQTLHRIRAVI